MLPDSCHANMHEGCCGTQAHTNSDIAYNVWLWSALQHHESTTCTETWPDAVACKTNKDTSFSQCRNRICCCVSHAHKAEEKTLRYIVQTRKRRGTLSKRTKSIIKKAHELNMLTASQVLVLIADESGRVHTFATKKLESILADCQKHSERLAIKTCEHSNK